MTKRRLPIGIQTFREIREENCYYVDKTAYMQRLIDEGKHYFLSRPRRFGKSLFLDTLKELFEGNEPLFEGLHIHDHWDWSVRYPVLRLDFSSGNYQGPDDLRKEVAVQLDALEHDFSPRDEDEVAAVHFITLDLFEFKVVEPWSMAQLQKVHRPRDEDASGRLRHLWPFTSTITSTCSSSRWWNWRLMVRRWRSCRRRDTRNPSDRGRVQQGYPQYHGL